MKIGKAMKITGLAKDTGVPVPFTVTVRGADGTVLAEGMFQFKAEQEKMFLTFTADGTIEETGPVREE